MSRAYYMWHKFHNSSKRQHFSSEEEIICISVLDLACKMEETAIRLAEMARFVHLMFHPESKLGVKVFTALRKSFLDKNSFYI